MNKEVAIEYGDTWIEISVPENATVVQYGTPTFPKIPSHPKPEHAVRNALEHPVGLEPIADLVKRGSRVTIAFDDPIKRPERVHRIVDIFAGHVPDLEKIEYPEADKYFLVKIPQFDIIIIGLPHTLDHDTSDNPACACNFASRPARGWRNKPIL